MSRGEQKLVISMLKLAQGLLLSAQKNIEPLYLFDDLSSELDLKHRRKIAEHLTEGKAQIFISSIEEQHLFDEPAHSILLK